MGFPGGSDGKESAFNAGDPGSIPGMGRSRGKVFLPGESHGQRSLVVYSPWGHKESDTTEPLTLSLSHAKYVVHSEPCTMNSRMHNTLLLNVSRIKQMDNKDLAHTSQKHGISWHEGYLI